jgi:hypothetical protein
VDSREASFVWLQGKLHCSFTICNSHVCETNELKMEENNEIKKMERKPKNDGNMDFLVLNAL